jgi:DNA (cytosine-5)-methyltransferase 1
MGKKLGFADTRGTMFFEIERILKYHKPKAILLENVKQLVTHDGGKTLGVILESLKKIGYFVRTKVLNALDFGLPQKRERVLLVGFLDQTSCEEFSFEFEKVPYDLSSVLESDASVDKKLFASKEILKKRKERTVGKKLVYPSIWHENKAGNISVLEYACALRTGASYNYLLVNGYRRLSSRELLRLQGFPETFKIAVSHSEIRKQTGNSVPVSLIRAVALRMDGALISSKGRHG